MLFLGDKDYPPVTFLDNGVPRGMDVDLVRALGEGLRREVRIELLDWDLAQENFLKGEADALVGLSVTDERRELFDFASATYSHEFGLLARRDSLLIQGGGSLTGRKVGVTRSGFPRQVIEAQQGIHLVFVDNYAEGLDRLIDGTLDAFAADLQVAAYLIERRGLKGIALVGRPFASCPAAIAVRKGNKELLTQLNRALNRVRIEGTLSEIESRWEPHELLFFSREKVRNTLILGSLALLCLLCGGMTLWVLTLQKQIRSRKQAEEALRNSEQRLRTLSDASFEGIGLCEDGIIIDANDQLVKMLGYTRAEMIGKPVMDFVAPNSREYVRNVTESGGFQRYEHQALRKDGTTFTVEVCGRVIWNEPHVVRVTAVRDIAERKLSEERLELLQTITMDVSAATNLHSAFEVVLRRVCEKTGWILGQAWMPSADRTVLTCCTASYGSDHTLNEFREVSRGFSFPPGKGLPGRVWESGEAIWVSDVTQELNFPRARAAQKSGIRAGLGVPILSGDTVVAVLEFFVREPRREEERLVQLIAAIAAQIGLLIERKRAEEEVRNSQAELRALAGRLQAIREEERTRIAREIHDVLAQDLTRLKIDLGWLSKRIVTLVPDSDRSLLIERIAQLNNLADSTITTVQKIAAELRPVVLDSLGLFAAIEWLAEDFEARTRIKCEAMLPDEEVDLPRESATGIFRIVQESLTNVIRHSGATRVEITLEVEVDQLRLMIRDNGVGFNESRMRDIHSLGLLGMRERALLLDAEFHISGHPGKGTLVSVIMPLHSNSAPNENEPVQTSGAE